MPRVRLYFRVDPWELSVTAHSTNSPFLVLSLCFFFLAVESIRCVQCTSCNPPLVFVLSSCAVHHLLGVSPPVQCTNCNPPLLLGSCSWGHPVRAVHHWFFLLQLCITLRVSPIHLMEPVLVLAVESIRCVQCTTDEDPSCAASPTLETHNCSVGMNHCVVYYGVFKSGQPVFFQKQASTIKNWNETRMLAGILSRLTTSTAACGHILMFFLGCIRIFSGGKRKMLHSIWKVLKMAKSRNGNKIVHR